MNHEARILTLEVRLGEMESHVLRVLKMIEDLGKSQSLIVQAIVQRPPSLN